MISQELKDEREKLELAVDGTYSPDHFPGSKGYREHRAAMKELSDFDKAHPEVKKAIDEAKKAEEAKKFQKINIFNI